MADFFCCICQPHDDIVILTAVIFFPEQPDLICQFFLKDT